MINGLNKFSKNLAWLMNIKGLLLRLFIDATRCYLFLNSVICVFISKWENQMRETYCQTIHNSFLNDIKTSLFTTLCKLYGKLWFT